MTTCYLQGKLISMMVYYENRRRRIKAEMEKLLRYSLQLAMLKQLLVKKLISEKEYAQVKTKLMRDYGVASDIVA